MKTQLTYLLYLSLPVIGTCLVALPFGIIGADSSWYPHLEHLLYQLKLLEYFR